MLAFARSTQYMCNHYAAFIICDRFKICHILIRMLQGCLEDSLRELAELRKEEQQEMDNFLAAMHADIVDMDAVMDGLENALDVLSSRDISSDQEKHYCHYIKFFKYNL